MRFLQHFKLRTLLLSLLALGLLWPAEAVVTSDKAPSEKTSRRIIVKFKKPLADQVEPSLSGSTMQAGDQVSNARVRDFLKRHRLKRLKALYPDLVRAKRTRKVSDETLAAEVRKKYSKRARRFSKSFSPPVLSRTYVLDPQTIADPEVDALVQSLKQSPDVEYAEREAVYRVQLTPDDPFYSSQGTWNQTYDDLWGLKKIEAGSAWDTNAGDGVLVAVVDTGVDVSHPDLQPNLWKSPSGDYGYNFVEVGQPMKDGHGHGTHVSGTVAAVGNNQLGVVGVAWRSKVMAVRALDDNGSGSLEDIASGVRFAADHGAQVINMSLGGPSSMAMTEAVQYAYQLGVVIVVAAGNSQADAMTTSPANLPECITVAAYDSKDQQAFFSNFGPKIDVAAPGVDILSTIPNTSTLGDLYPGQIVGDHYMRLQGTSMASPHVAGAAALIVSQHPAYTHEQVRAVLRASADDVDAPGYDLNSGYGRINVAKALQSPVPPQVAIVEPHRGAVVGEIVDVRGTAAGDGFTKYVLEHGAGESPLSWTLIQQGDHPVLNGVLGSFNPAGLAEGVHSLRLTVFIGNSPFQQVIPIVLKSAEISWPVSAPNEQVVVVGVHVPFQIRGTAAGVQFQKFRLEWAPGIDAQSGWSSNGVTLSGNGVKSIVDDVLASFDAKVVPNAGYITFRLVVDRAGVSDEKRVPVYVEPDLAGHWPQFIGANSVLPVLVEEGNHPWVMGQYPLPYTLDGSLIADLTQFVAYGHFRPVQGEFGKLGKVVIANIGFNWLYVFQGSSVIPLNANFYDEPIGGTLADVNDDGENELIVVSRQGHLYDADARYRLHVVPAHGPEWSGRFPIDLGADVKSVFRQVFVDDADGDGDKEIQLILQQNHGPYVSRRWTKTGAAIPSADVTFSQFQESLRKVARVQWNGEAVWISYKAYLGKLTLSAIREDGTLVSGWPFEVQGGGAVTDDFAIGDLDNDGVPDIALVSTGKIFVLNAQGQIKPGWPVDNHRYKGPIVLGDVSGDRKTDVITSFVEEEQTLSRGWLAALHSNGQPIKKWKVMSARLANHPLLQPRFDYLMELSLGDYDGNGKLDMGIVAKYYDFLAPATPEASFYRLDAAYDADALQWPSFLHDWQNSGIASKKEIAPTTPGEIIVTADNQYELYFNGAKLGASQGGPADWNSAEKYPIQIGDGKNVVAIKAVDAGGIAGLLAEIKTATGRFGSGVQWKINRTYTEGWDQADFDDSSWSTATDYGSYGVAQPWTGVSPVQDMPSDTPAHWIWSADAENDDLVYARFTFENQKPNGKITVTADNGYALYVNGNPMGAGTNWTEAQQYPVTWAADRNVVAIKATDAGGAAGLLVDVIKEARRWGSSVDWKVSKTFSPGWEGAAFDDSSWTSSTDYGAYGVALPWATAGSVTKMPALTPGRWIWTADNEIDDTAYFRFTFTNQTGVPVNRSPTARFTTPGGPYVTDSVITFLGGDSLDQDGTIVSYSWDFGEGVPGNPTPLNYGKHSYSKAGPYTVRLTVTDNLGATHSYAQKIDVRERIRTGELTVSSDNGYEAFFNGVSLGTGDNWNLSQKYNLTVLPDKNVVAIKATDAGGVAGLLVDLVQEFRHWGSGVDWKVSKTFTPGWQEASFDDSQWASATDYGAYGVAVPWARSGAVAEMPTETPGRWIWTDDHDLDDTAYFRFTFTNQTGVPVNRPPTAVFRVSVGEPRENETIPFNAGESRDQDGRIVSYFWDFGDGSTSETPLTLSYTDHLYPKPGTYKVKLTVTDNLGEKHSYAELVTIHPFLRPGEIRISADNGYEAYFNGERLGAGDNWFVAQKYDVQVGNRNVLAIRAADAGYVAALLAEVVVGPRWFGSSAQWKISTTAPAGWESPDFDDSQWAQATDYGAYGVAQPWTSVASVANMTSDTPAHWIWSAQSELDDVLYVRFTFTHGDLTGEPPVVSLEAPILEASSVMDAQDSLKVHYPGTTPLPIARYVWSAAPVLRASSMEEAAARRIRANTKVLSTPSGATALSALAMKSGPYRLSVHAVLADGRMSPATSTTINVQSVVTGTLSGSKVYPNPWRADQHSNQDVTFAGIPSGGAVKIFTVDGRWVRTLQSTGVPLSWDRRNNNGESVASGIYLYLINDSQGSKTRGKLVLIR